MVFTSGFTLVPNSSNKNLRFFELQDFNHVELPFSGAIWQRTGSALFWPGTKVAVTTGTRIKQKKYWKKKTMTPLCHSNAHVTSNPPTSELEWFC